MRYYYFKYIMKKCQQLFSKHYLSMCETVDRLKIIDVEKDAIIKQTEFN